MIEIGTKGVFHQKITRDHGRKPLKIDRPAVVTHVFEDVDVRCRVCHRTLEEHEGPKHAYEQVPVQEFRVQVEIPDGPEFDPYTGEPTNPPVQTETIEYVRQGDNFNEFTPNGD